MKHLTLSLIISTSLFVCLVESASKKKETVDCGSEGKAQLDEQLSQWVIFASDRHFPTTSQEMKTYCRESQAMERSVKSFATNCFRGFIKSLINVGTHGFSKTNKNICRSPRRSQQFYGLGQCGNQRRAEVRQCVDKVADSVQLVKTFNQSDYKMIMPYLCCQVNKMKSCILSVYQKVGPPKCTDQNLDQINELFDKFLYDVINFACSEYNDDSDKCDKIHKRFSGKNQVKVTGERKVKSPVLAIVEVLKYMETIDL